MNMTANSAGFAGTAVAGDDLDLVHATQNGDVSAFGQLVARYDRKLLRIAHHVTHNREDSQDAVQESFMKALQHLGEFREHSRFSTWLFRITVNQALMELRKRRTAVDVSLDEAFRADEDYAATPPEMRFAFAQLLELFQGQSSKSEVISELFWASLHGIAELTRTKRFPRSRQKERVRALVELFAFPS